jgi:hypothetical protein
MGVHKLGADRRFHFREMSMRSDRRTGKSALRLCAPRRSPCGCSARASSNGGPSRSSVESGPPGPQPADVHVRLPNDPEQPPTPIGADQLGSGSHFREMLVRSGGPARGRRTWTSGDGGPGGPLSGCAFHDTLRVAVAHEPVRAAPDRVTQWRTDLQVRSRRTSTSDYQMIPNSLQRQ